MKKYLFLLLLLAGSQLNAQFKTANLQASGLTCAMCSNAIFKSLQKIPFVAGVQPNIKESSFDIQFKPNAAVDFDALKKAVEDAGFSVARLNVKGNFQNVSVEKDTHVKLHGHQFHFLHTANRRLQGDVNLQIVDKDFVAEKVFRKYAATTNMQCVKTGKMESCCNKSAAKSSSPVRIYHVTI